ncbi:class I SAM-dependent methyltransferase [Kordiimonas lacus]|uniref:Ubiquinone/menaquinone biosynthesis C-methylase UbiE n=1 Tax=Kordiimonas lacus TaxID=637679 RepID=A0A1G6T7L6_9PROT|nr:class I SAM-dependent methyltransferase [Kordiimonas lacus]SDD25031.1 Ubiquinone/menaquinone biosynthesis C-methylase UbiE [Kordiimonas lacus]
MSTSANFVGSVPTFYDEGLGPVLFHHYANDISARAAAHGPGSVLELAAGTGIVTQALRRALPAGATITATDLNPPMLGVAQNKLKGEAGVNFQPANAQDLPFDDGMFDMLVCQFGIMFFPDKLQSLMEARRVLKPGGRYIFNVWDSWANNPFAELTHNTVAQFFETDPPTFYQVPFGYHDVAAIEATVRDAGFSDVTHTRLCHQSPIKDIGQFAKALVFGNPIREEILDRGGDPDAVVNAIERALQTAFGQSGSTPLEAIVFTAVR